MSEPRLLSGEEIVAKGATKASASLPEIGLKDVTPNGSWLEQKQIQSALDARKQLIEVERIEKWGNVSHAQWREDLMLAEVTKQTGGYWQYLGHHTGKVLYLNPEEALYLMEVNCLHLKYNDVTVSLQQAYSLLLRGQVSFMQYKVYASLSRLGYKVFRFSKPKTDNLHPNTSTNNQTTNIKGSDDNIPLPVDRSKEDVQIDENLTQNMSSDIISDNNQNDDKSEMDTSDVKSGDAVSIAREIPQIDVNNVDSKYEIVKAPKENETEIKEDADKDVIVVEAMETDSNEHVNCGEEIAVSNNIIALNNTDYEISVIQKLSITATDSTPCSSTSNCKELNMTHSKKDKLVRKRQLRSHNAKELNKYFDSIPDLLQKDTVTVTVPTNHLPVGVTPLYSSYEVNLNKVRSKNIDPIQSEPNTFHANQRITQYRFESSSSQPVFNNQTYIYSNIRFQRQPLFNQFHFWRPRSDWNSFSYNMFFQRPFIRNTFFAPRFQFFPRQPTYFRSFNTTTTRPVNNATDFTVNGRSNSINSRKRTRDNEQVMRLNTIKNLASNLKSKRLIQVGNNIGLVNLLQNLIKIYNARYYARIRLTNDFEIDENEFIVDTITLDDDEVAAKKPRNESNKFEENFSKIQQMASKLKELESKELATPRHRRALSSVVRTFNDSFNADIYMNENFDIVDRRHIVLDSSSDSDCVIKETEVKKHKKRVGGKKVRNPFNLLKTLTEKSKNIASCSKDNEIVEMTNVESEDKPDKEYSEEMKRSFKSWLPKSSDFGRAEIAPKSLMLSRLVEANKQIFLFDFIKNNTCKFINWLDVKISFLENMEYAASLFHDEHIMDNSSDWDSIIKPEDCKDMPSVLNKLSIIPNNSDINRETSLRIDFDVYNRDVQNFKKRNVPKPHFRIICVDQSSGLPPGTDVATLHARCGDVPIVFAVVGQSISYIQIKPTNLPVYIPDGEPA